MLIEGILESYGDTEYDKIFFFENFEIWGVWGPISIFGHFGINIEFHGF